ncbi:tRNA threonylcarbamoyladenosine biosynthesis protein TsaB [subsurface metagenome]
MIALALDTATEALGICLQVDERLSTVILKAGLKHCETLLPWLNQLFREAGISPRNLDLIVCSVGPGSFTGVRIGLATAKGLALGSGCTLVGVSNLDALAYRFRYFDGIVLPVLSALRRRYYASLYRQGERISDYLDLSFDLLALRLQSWDRVLLTGAGAESLLHLLKKENKVRQITLDAGLALTDPQSLLQLGRKRAAGKEIPGQEVKPLYLRKSEAEINLYGA